MKHRFYPILICFLLALFAATPAVTQQDDQLILKLNRDFGYGGMGNDIQGLFSLEIRNPPADLARVEFTIDGQLIAEDDSSPYKIQFSTDSYRLGEHVLAAIGYTNNGKHLSSNEFTVFGAMILTGEFIAIYRRFVMRTVPFKTSLGDIFAVNLLGGWFILRFFCEATSILTYSLPTSVAQYWFISFGLSKIMAPLGLPWSSLNYPLWSLSGLFLATLVGFIPYNKKLWHIITIPVVMFINLMPKESFRPGTKKTPLPLSVKELIVLDSCVKCGSCVDVCPVYSQNQQLEITMGGFFTNLKSFIRKAYGFPGMVLGRGKTTDELKQYSEHPYLCTLCGRCVMVCPAFIDAKDLRMAGREFMVEKGEYPPVRSHAAPPPLQSPATGA